MKTCITCLNQHPDSHFESTINPKVCYLCRGKEVSLLGAAVMRQEINHEIKKQSSFRELLIPIEPEFFTVTKMSKA